MKKNQKNQTIATLRRSHNIASWVYTDGKDVFLQLRVLPASKETKTAGFYQNRLKIKVTAAPTGGQANKAVIKYLATVLKTSTSNITVIKGQTSRDKLVKVKAASLDWVKQALTF